MARGRFRIKGERDFVQVEFGPFSRPIPENEYRAKGYQPALETLRWETPAAPEPDASRKSEKTMLIGGGGSSKDD